MKFLGLYFILFYILYFLPNNILAQPEFQKKYAVEYKDALKKLFDNKKIIQQKIPAEYIAEAIACVFPEMVRFSEMKNMIEVSSLELLYVKWGERYADFSIGFFQMKPSFIESMENYVSNNRLSAQIFMPLSTKQDEESKRQNRINHLRTWDGQLTYLKAFWQITSIRFKDKKFENKNQKVHFFATAYNRGFLNTEQEIIKWQNKYFFPDGRIFKGKQYNYGNVAQEFYEKYALKLFK